MRALKFIFGILGFVTGVLTSVFVIVHWMGRYEDIKTISYDLKPWQQVASSMVISVSGYMTAFVSLRWALIEKIK